MEIIAAASDWTQNDEEQLLKFLESAVGQRLIPRLADMAPPLLEEGDTNKILIRAGKLRGYQEALLNLIALSHSTKETPATEVVAYPALDNDAAWNDGQKLNE